MVRSATSRARRTIFRAIVPPAMVVMVAASCGDSLAPSASGLLVFAPRDTLISLGETMQLTAARLHERDTIATRVTWMSLAPGIVSVTADGTVRAEGPGRAEIHATSPDSLTGSTTLTVHQVIANLTVVAPADSLPEADSMALTVSARDPGGSPVTGRAVSWSVDDGTRARVDPAGVITGLRRGTVTVGATVDGVTGARELEITDGFLAGMIWNSTFQGRVCAVDLDGRAACWPHGDTLAVNLSDTLRFRSMTAGDNHDCGTAVDGRAFCVGGDGHGELGLGFVTTRHDTLVAAWPARRFRFVMASDHDFTCGITTLAESLCWGHNDLGQLGRGFRSSSEVDAAPVLGVAGLDTIDVEGLHACGLAGGAAHCWGAWRAGGPSDSALRVAGGIAFTQISVGHLHNCALTSGGAAHCWGVSFFGLGSGDSTVSDAPRPVVGGLAFSMISAGELHTCGVTPDGAVWCWGSNRSRQLGIAGGDALVPTRAAPGVRARAVAAGSSDTCVISELRSVFCWGTGSEVARRVRRGGAAAPTPPAAVSYPRAVHPQD